MECIYLATERNRISVLQLTDDGAVDDPLESLGGPVKRVGVPGLLRSCDVVLDHAIVGGSVALAEEVGLDLVVDATEEISAILMQKLEGFQEDLRLYQWEKSRSQDELQNMKSEIMQELCMAKERLLEELASATTARMEGVETCLPQPPRNLDPDRHLHDS